MPTPAIADARATRLVSSRDVGLKLIVPSRHRVTGQVEGALGGLLIDSPHPNAHLGPIPAVAKLDRQGFHAVPHQVMTTALPPLLALAFRFLALALAFGLGGTGSAWVNPLATDCSSNSMGNVFCWNGLPGATSKPRPP